MMKKRFASKLLVTVLTVGTVFGTPQIINAKEELGTISEEVLTETEPINMVNKVEETEVMDIDQSETLVIEAQLSGQDLSEDDAVIEPETKHLKSEEAGKGSETFEEISVPEEKAVRTATVDNVNQTDFGFEINSQTKEATLTAYKGTDTTIVTPQSVIKDGVSYPVTAIGSDSERFKYGKAVTKVIISEGVKKIGTSSFAELPGFEAKITEMILPSTLESIGQRAFLYQYSLKSITLPVGLKEIGEEAFAFTGLTSVEIPEGVKELKSQILWKCMDLDRVTIPASVEKIHRDFSDENYTRYVQIAPDNAHYRSQNNSIIQKKDNVLFLCMASADIYTTPKGVTEIGPYAFQGVAIRKIIVRDEVTKIGEGAFSGAEVQEIRLSKNLRKIPAKLFQYCYELKVIIPDGVQSIGDEAFLQTGGGLITIPASVKTIGKNVFPAECNIQFLRKTPPKVTNLRMTNDKKKPNIYVPKGKQDAYQKAFKNKKVFKNLKFKEVKEKKIDVVMTSNSIYICDIYGANVANYKFKVSGGKYSSDREITGLKKNKTYTLYARSGKEVLKLKVKTLNLDKGK